MAKRNMRSVSNSNGTLENGWTTNVDYVRTIDGDTIVFSITRTFNVRLRNIDVDELNTEKGQKAKDFVEDIMEHSNNIQIFVPSNSPEKLMDFISFERIVADVYINGKNLRETLIKKRLEKQITAT
jgi:endonuclease YncB( thermonuclease family)